MKNPRDLDQIRSTALARYDLEARRQKQAILVAALIEGLFLGGFLLLADMGNRTHLLLLISTIAVYSIVGAGLFAVALFVNRAVLRVLKAVELLEAKVIGTSAGEG